MGVLRRVSRALISSVLLVGLLGLLAAYVMVVNDLPSRLYTEVQQEYLAYNSARSVAQLSPTWVVKSESDVAPAYMPMQKSQVRTRLEARYEDRDGVSVTVYDLTFQGVYRLEHTGAVSETVELYFPFPGNLDTLHQVIFSVDGTEPSDVSYRPDGIRWLVTLEPGEAHEVSIGYCADGASSFSYGLQHGQRADVDVEVAVQGVTGSSVSKNALPASNVEYAEDRELWVWRYEGLIAEKDIQLELPARLSFAQRVALLQDDLRVLAGMAPPLVGLYLLSLAGAFYLSGLRLPIETYLLAGCGLALYYPMLTFLSGLAGVVPAAIGATVIVAGLQVGFLGMVIGWRQARWRVGLLLAVFVGFASLGMLTPWRGLMLSVGGILLVGMFMVLYAQRKSVQDESPRGSTTSVAGAEGAVATGKADAELTSSRIDVDDEIDESLSGIDVEVCSVEAPTECDRGAVPMSQHCPFCGRELEGDYVYCPGCGHDTTAVRACTACGHQQRVVSGQEKQYCVQCGVALE